MKLVHFQGGACAPVALLVCDHMSMIVRTTNQAKDPQYKIQSKDILAYDQQTCYVRQVSLRDLANGVFILPG